MTIVSSSTYKKDVRFVVYWIDYLWKKLESGNMKILTLNLVLESAHTGAATGELPPKAVATLGGDLGHEPHELILHQFYETLKNISGNYFWELSSEWNVFSSGGRLVVNSTTDQKHCPLMTNEDKHSLTHSVPSSMKIHVVYLQDNLNTICIKANCSLLCYTW